MRKRFKPAERERFTVGAEIEWRNVSHWHPAVVTSEVKTDDTGTQYVLIVHKGETTRTVSRGDDLRGYPGNIR